MNRGGYRHRSTLILQAGQPDGHGGAKYISAFIIIRLIAWSFNWMQSGYGSKAFGQSQKPLFAAMARCRRRSAASGNMSQQVDWQQSSRFFSRNKVTGPNIGRHTMFMIPIGKMTPRPLIMQEFRRMRLRRYSIVT